MIGRFFSWLGQIFSSFITWLGSLIYNLFSVLLESFNNFISWLYDLITTLAADFLSFVLGLVPNLDPGNVAAAITFMRRAWNTFDVFVPLHEGLVFVTTYFGVYFTVKLVSLVIRVVLGLIP